MTRQVCINKQARHYCLLLAALPFCAFAQSDADNLQVLTTDAQTWEMPIDGIGRILLGEESFSLNDANETALRTFRYDEVEKISFRLTTSGISLPVHFQENLRLETSDSHLRVYGLDGETPTPVEVYDAAGRRVAQASLTSDGQLNIAAFTAGAYILKAAGQTLKFKVQ